MNKDLFRYTDNVYEVDPETACTREEIYQGLEERIADLRRYDSPRRVCVELGVDMLLDGLVAIQKVEEWLEIEDYANGTGS